MSNAQCHYEAMLIAAESYSVDNHMIDAMKYTQMHVHLDRV